VSITIKSYYEGKRGRKILENMMKYIRKVVTKGFREGGNYWSYTSKAGRVEVLFCEGGSKGLGKSMCESLRKERGGIISSYTQRKKGGVHNWGKKHPYNFMKKARDTTSKEITGEGRSEKK